MTPPEKTIAIDLNGNSSPCWPPPANIEEKPVTIRTPDAGSGSNGLSATSRATQSITASTEPAARIVARQDFTGRKLLISVGLVIAIVSTYNVLIYFTSRT